MANYVTILRGIGIIGVLWIHASAPVMRLDYYNSQVSQDIFVVLNQFARFSVPLFFFLSGYLYGRKYFEHKLNYFLFVRKRFQKILVPYLFWSCFYISLRIVTRDIVLKQETVIDIIILFLTGKAWGHLYFVSVICQYYLLLPFFVFVSRLIVKCDFCKSIIFLIALFYIIVLYCRGNVLNNSMWMDEFWIYWWAPFILLGMFDGMRERRESRVNSKVFLIVVISIVCSFLLMNYEVLSVYHGLFMKDSVFVSMAVDSVVTFLRPSAVIYAFCFIYLLLNTQLMRKIDSSLLYEFGKYSFGIYLIHPFVNKCIIYVCKLCNVTVTGQTWIAIFLFVIGGGISFVLVKYSFNIKSMNVVLGSSR